MPKLWHETIQAHRSAVHEAIVDATAQLVAQHGLLSVSMSQIAQETGIGRATLYKYYPDVESILRAWHQRQVAGHLATLSAINERDAPAGERLAAVLAAYADIQRERVRHDHFGPHGSELASYVHADEAMIPAQHQLHELVCDLMTAAATEGTVRDDVAADELTSFCMHALAAAAGMPSKAAVRRLVATALRGLRPQP